MVEVTAAGKRIVANIEKVIVGKRQEIVLALVAYFAEGHILLEDVPGRGQDDAGAGPGPERRVRRSSGSSARPTCCRPT